MNLKISFKNIKHSEAVEERIRQKTKKIEKYLMDSCSVSWICNKRENSYHVEVEVYGHKFDHHATAHSSNFYKALDLAVAKLYRQLGKKRDKWKNAKIHHKRQRLGRKEIHFLTRNMPLIVLEAAWDDYEANELENYDDVEEAI